MIPATLPRARSLFSFRLAVLSLWTALFLLAGAGKLRAQCPPDFEGGNFVCSPPGIPGSYKRLVCGDLSGDWNQEVATIKDNRLIVYHGPNVYNASVEVEEAAGAVDLCFAPDTDGQGTPGFLYTTSTGLARVTFDQGQHEYESSTVSTSLPWKNALVRWAPPVLGPSGADTLFAVQSDLRTVFRSIKDSGGYSTLTVLFDAGYLVLDLVPLNWDSDIELELAILHEHGVHVREQDGTLRMSRAGTIAGDAIAVVRKTGSTDSLAWITRLGGLSKLLLFNKSFPTQGPTAISDRTFGSMASADLEPDGDDDLALASSSVDGLTILRNAPVMGQWFPGTYETVNMSVAGGPQASSGMVLCSNLFNDWTPSETPIPGYALVLAGSDGLRLKSMTPTPPPELADLQEGPTYRSGMDIDGCGVHQGSHSRWTMTLGNGWGLTTATHVQMIVRKCEPVTETVPEETAFDSELFSITGPPSNPVNGTVVYFDGVEDDEEESSIRYFVQVRPVKVNASTGAIQRVWRWSLLGVSASCQGTGLLLELPDAQYNASFATYFDCCWFAPPPEGCPRSIGANFVPSAVPLSQIPGGPGTWPGDPPQ